MENVMGHRALLAIAMGITAAVGAGCVGDPAGGAGWVEEAAFVAVVEAASELNARSGEGLDRQLQARDIARMCGERGLLELGSAAIDGVSQSARYDLVVGLERGGYEDLAHDVALDMAPSRHRDQAISALSTIASFHGTCDVASELLHQMSEGATRDIATSDVAMCLTRTGQYDAAVTLAEGIQQESRRYWTVQDALGVMLEGGFNRQDLPPVESEAIDFALQTVAESQAYGVRCERGLELSRQIADERSAAKALSFVGTCFVVAGEAERGDALLAEAESLELQRLPTCEAAEALVTVGRLLEGYSLTERARGRAERALSLGVTECMDGCRLVALLLADTGAFESAVELAASCSPGGPRGRSIRAEALYSVAYTVARAGRLEQTRRAVGMLDEGERSASTIASAANGLVAAGLHEEAMELLEELPDMPSSFVLRAQENVLREIQWDMMEQGLGEEATALAAAADPSMRDELFFSQAAAYALDDDTDEAIAAVAAMGDEEVRHRALDFVIPAHLRQGRIDAARELTETLPPEHRRQSAESLAEAHMEAGDVAAALSVALLLESDVDRAAVLVRVGRELDADARLSTDELDLLLRISGDDEAFLP